MAAFANDLISYDQETGVFTWLVSRKRVKAGQRAGNEFKAGSGKPYREVKVDGVRYQEHQLAFLLVEGHIPEIIDHNDGDGLNNKWDNLRPATSSQNQCNIGLKTNNTSGHKNVYWHKRSGSWHVQVRYLGKDHHFGYYDSLEEACSVADSKRKILHGDFENGSTT